MRDILRCHGGVGHKVEREGEISARRELGEDFVGERELREVSTNVVRARVEPDFVFESSVVNLEVVRFATPATQPGRRTFPDRRVFDVMSIYPDGGLSGLVRECRRVENDTIPMVQSQYG